MAKVIQRNLALDTTYSIISSRYSTDPCICDNCYRPINNIATIQNKDGDVFSVGLDCAQTLSGLHNSYELLMVHQPAFDEAHALRSKLLKERKKYTVENYSSHKLRTTTVPDAKTETISIYLERRVEYSSGESSMLGYSFHSQERWFNYIYPLIKDLL